MTAADDSGLLDAVVAAVREAAAIVLEFRRRGLTVERKADATPVTVADREAERVILARLRQARAELPVVAEEACAAGLIPKVAGAFFLVDALDGTKEYVRGGDDFTVNVALVRDTVPVLGAVAAPAAGVIYAGLVGVGAWTARTDAGSLAARRAIRVRAPARGAVDIVASRSHRTPETDAWIARHPAANIVSTGSSLKFCLLAEGKADLYPRMGTTMQWDTAAGDAVLRAAGGLTVTLDGRPLPYGPNGDRGAAAYVNPWFVAAGSAGLLEG